MKLGENGIRKRKVKAREVLVPEKEPELGFDPRVDLTETDWTRVSSDIKNRFKLNLGIHMSVTSLMEIQYLDPDRFHLLIENLRLPDQLNLQSEFPRGVSFSKKLLYRIAIKDVFPEQEAGTFTEEKKMLVGELIFARQREHIDSVLEILYIFRRSPAPKLEEIARTPIDLTFRQAEFDAFLKQWDEVWGTGNLTDVTPDKLVRMLAMLRVVDPEKFQQVKLDQQFWSLAKEWLQELRNDNQTASLFEFAFHLHLLSAGSIQVNQEGKLVIESKKQNLKRVQPLPERSVA